VHDTHYSLLLNMSHYSWNTGTERSWHLCKQSNKL